MWIVCPDVRSVARSPFLVKPAHHCRMRYANFIDRVTDSCVPVTPRCKFTATGSERSWSDVMNMTFFDFIHDISVSHLLQ
jgi:hypothetical protein